ncbi:zinc finger, CCHC-type containing protein [Tanacetum coccineum]
MQHCKQIRIRAKWENDDYICRGHILNEESLRAQDSDKGKGKEVTGPSVNMAEEGKNKNNKQNKGKKRDYKEHGIGSGSNKKPKLECWKCGKTGHFKRDCRSGELRITQKLWFGKSILYAAVDADCVYKSCEDSSSTSDSCSEPGLGGAISWASKKQTYINGSTMESEFMALTAAGKEA